MKTAIFIDTMSIQKYIFASNSLKENIGASYNVKEIFNDMENQYKEEKCYIGGGNALLLFDDKDRAESAMKEWTKSILIKYPGVIPIVTIDKHFDESDFSESRKKIILRNIENKNRNIPITTLQSFGITATCNRTDYSAEIYNGSPEDDQGYISFVSYAKLQNSQKAVDELNEKFKDMLNTKYKFTNQLDKLGGSKGDNNHIAVVHIDGNDMRDIFKKINDQKDILTFSEDMKTATEGAFRKMLEELINNYKAINQELTLCDGILPLRPIIIGGDDITFVCDARLGFYLAEIFMNAFENQEVCKKERITCCAGISIVKTKYPFYRAYSIAEELCSNAKKKRKEEGILDSMWDFHISFGGLGGLIDNIRDTEYKTGKETLYKRPYKLSDFKKLKECIYEIEFSEKNKLPQDKIKKLRDALYQGETATTEFIKELDYRNRKLPKFEHDDEVKKGFVNTKTPYLDIIEMIDFCPEFYLPKEDESNV